MVKTIAISDELWKKLKIKAAHQEKTIREIVEEKCQNT